MLEHNLLDPPQPLGVSGDSLSIDNTQFSVCADVLRMNQHIVADAYSLLSIDRVGHAKFNTIKHMQGTLM